MKDIYEMACDVVNPDGGDLNETQENEVIALVDFAKMVLLEFIASQHEKEKETCMCGSSYFVRRSDGVEICDSCGMPRTN